jgi:hypothetical protein
MALLTRPANVLKNTAANFVVDLAELSALPGVPVGYYKDTNNWKELFIKVTHTGSNQKSVIRFFLPATTGSLLVSDTARAGTWQIESIMIRDFDRGEVLLNRADIPSVESYDFFVISAATHGDLLVTNGQTVTIPANATRQYGDIVIDTGGVLEVEDGGGILTLEALGNCVINGTIKATNGKHLGGVWNKTSPLGESLSHTVTQKTGGNGGAGEDFEGSGGAGGLASFGNGGAGGRSAKFIAQAGDDAIDVEAGQGLGQSETADEHGEKGLDSTAPAQTAGGGFRGAHGQSVYIKAARIQGSGTINASGQKGGNGGDGGEYLSEGELYANGPGGGAAGGDGGNVWLRAKKGTPLLTVNTLGGERGTRGVASSGASEAQHGIAGSNGSYSFSLF